MLTTIDDGSIGAKPVFGIENSMCDYVREKANDKDMLYISLKAVLLMTEYKGIIA